MLDNGGSDWQCDKHTSLLRYGMEDWAIKNKQLCYYQKYILLTDIWSQCNKNKMVNYYSNLNPTFLGLKYHGILMPL